MLNAKDIKDWLKTIGKNREWLAEKTLVSKRTVDNWITTNRPIPPAKLALIEKLMSGEEEIEFELPPDFEKQLRAMADEAKKNYRGYGFPYPSSHSQGTSEKESRSSQPAAYPGRTITCCIFLGSACPGHRQYRCWRIDAG